ncbi:MAG: SPOR domain-containing protein [Candidatus Binataceae bacterium]
MRFEIRSGGGVAILAGLLLLSGAVFVLGLLAGYDVGRESQANLAQVATAYPVAPPPATESSPVSAVLASPAAIPASPAPETASRVPPPAVAQATPSARHSQRTVASVSTPAAAALARSRHQRVSAAEFPPSAPATARQPTENNSENNEQGGGEAADETPAAESSEAGEAAPVPASRTASAQPVAVAPRRKPYNIQIEAAMDINGADAMMRRLQRLGYQPHLVPTRIDGQTWFEVEVGPYATAQEAQEAQAQLRQKYAATYGTRTRGGASGNSGADNSEGGD